MGAVSYLTGDEAVIKADLRAEETIAQLVGASPDEICVMLTLSTNLHLLLLAFYKPTKQRYKILCEGKCFPSDFYVFQSQARLRGLPSDDAVICLEARPGEDCLRTEDVLEAIKEHADQLAVVCLSGVQFYTGQLFDMPAITRAAHDAGCFVGWDLAHAIGNVELSLHEWGVDFATWCHYKYVCGGAGAVAGAFVHARHANTIEPVLHGWWGHDVSSRFEMTNKMELAAGARAFHTSSPNVLSLAAVRCGAEVLLDAGIARLRTKSKLLTGYLEFLLKRRFSASRLRIITPSDPDQRGAQLSLKFAVDVTGVHRELASRGIVCDIRKPDVLRVAPKPIYNSFTDVFRFVAALSEILPLQNGCSE